MSNHREKNIAFEKKFTVVLRITSIFFELNKWKLSNNLLRVVYGITVECLTLSGL